MTGGSLSFSLLVLLSNLISNRIHWGVELHSQSRNSFSTEEKRMERKKRGIKEGWEMLSKCYLAISRATSKKRCRKHDIDELFWGRPSRVRLLCSGEHSLWQCTSTTNGHSEAHRPKTFHMEQDSSPPVTGTLEDLWKWNFCDLKENVKLIYQVNKPRVLPD